MAEEAHIEAIGGHSETTSERIDVPPHLRIGPGKSSQEGDSEGKEVDVSRYLDLHRAATTGDWNSAEKFFEKDQSALTKPISLQGMTVLHVAARNGQSEFVEKLVEKLSPEALAKLDKSYGRNALHYIATVGTKRAAEKMVEKNPNLPQQMDGGGYTPLYAAVLLGLSQRRREMVKFLASVTKEEAPSHSFTGELSTHLILGIVASGYYDVAIDLIRRYENLALARDEGETILHVIAKDPLAFASGSKISFWKRLLFPTTSIKHERNAKQRQEALCSLVEITCKKVLSLDNEEMQRYINTVVPTLHLATKNGLVELVQEILKYFPDSLWITQDDRFLLHVAIEHRRHNVFNYLIKLTRERKFAFSRVVVEATGNNILHLAAKLAPFEQLYSVSGTALQMQRELQWFKEVEKLVHSTSRWATNNDGKTPEQLFTEEHRELHKEAEEWLKGTAEQCMVVATLVATIVFAAMITVPGGIHSETGTPVFLKKITFLVFIIANGLAVFTSMTSLLVFLSILTSRYAEVDFLKSLPLKLVAGLSFLLMAIVTMTIAFAAALHIAVYSKFHLSYIFSIFLGCVPVILYLRLHLPLFLQVVKSTCGPGIFERNDQKHFWKKIWQIEKNEEMV